MTVHRLSFLTTTVVAVSVGIAAAEVQLPGYLQRTAVEQRMQSVTPLQGSRPAQWRIVWTEAPQQTATVSWSTAAAGERHRVYYDSQPHRGRLDEYAHSVVAARNGAYTLSAEDRKAGVPTAHYHHAVLTNLAPATSYYFVMASDDQVSPELHFTTAPDDDRPFSIIQGGDSRSDMLNRCRVNLLIAKLAAEDRSLLAIAHGGDFIGRGTRWGDWRRWLSHHELTVTAGGRILPLIPTRGNHDRGVLYDEIFNDPGGKEKNYFSTRLGAKVALVTLNTETRDPEQTSWLAGQLQRLSQSCRWLLVQYHKPLYPAVKRGAAMKSRWAPLFERYGVALGLEADGHVMKRTVPIRGDKEDPTGVIYLGEGGFGVPQRVPVKGRWYLRSPGFADRGHHLIRLDLSPERLRVRFVLLDGAARDDFELHPRRHPVGAASATEQPPAE